MSDPEPSSLPGPSSPTPNPNPAPAAGRIPTVSTEEEEEALESGIAATSTGDVVNTTAEVAQIASTDEEAVPASVDRGMEVDGQEPVEVKPENEGEGSNGKVNGKGDGDVKPAMTIPTGPAADAHAYSQQQQQQQQEAEMIKPDPYAVPDDACETLYIQNLNEKVQVEGELFAF
jgi:hypothetical protein